MSEEEQEEVKPQTIETGGNQIQSRQLNPAQLLNEAVKGDADVEVMERLMTLQERWEKNEAKKKFDRAMADLRSDLPEIVKDKQVSHKGGSYKYEDLSDVVSALAPVMADHGLSFRWKTKTKEGHVQVKCIISHELGHSEETELVAPVDNTGSKNAIQAIGSAVTYLQRYTLKAAVGVAAAPDDDAQSVGSQADGQQQSSPSQQDEDDRPKQPCPEHPDQMTIKREKNGDTWWAHQLDSGEWCNTDPTKVDEPFEEDEEEFNTSDDLGTLSTNGKVHRAIEAKIDELNLEYEDVEDPRKHEKELFKEYLGNVADTNFDSIKDVPVTLAEKVLQSASFERKYRRYLSSRYEHDEIQERLSELEGEGGSDVPF